MPQNFPKIETPIKQTTLVGRIEKMVDSAKSNVTQWEQNQLKWHKMRMRIKKDKTFPFVNSSNLRMPTVETYLRKAKAGILNVVFGLRPIIQAVPSPGGNLEAAGKLEKFYDHLIIDIMKLHEKAAILIDQTLEKGMYLAKVFWCLKIETRDEIIDMNDFSPEEKLLISQMPDEALIAEASTRLSIDRNENVAEFNDKAIKEAIAKIRAGEQKVTLTVQDVIYNAPDVAFVSPDKCFVPTYAGYDPQGLEWIVHEYRMPLSAIRRNAEYKKWNIDSIKDIERVVDSDDTSMLEDEKAAREGISEIKNSGLVKIREFYGYEDIGNKKKEKVCVTYAPDFGKEFRKIKWSPFSGKFPFVKFFYELADDRWFSHRGIPELSEDIIKEIDTQHNIKIDQQTIRNAPMFLYRSGMVNPNMVQMRPNQAIPVKGTMALGDAVQALNFHNPNVEYSYEREQQMLEAKMSEMLGQPDYSLQSMINRRQPRTLGEVQMQASGYQNVFAMDASMFATSFNELFNMILEAWSMYGPEEYSFVYFGQGGNGEVVKLNKEEIQNKYTITIRGNDSNTNPNVRLQKAQQVLMAITNPILLQNGVVTTPQIVEGLKRFYQALDVEAYESLINPNPQAIQPPPPDPVQRFGRLFKNLTQDEQAQVLQQAGLEPDLENRAEQEERNVVEKEAEVADKMFTAFGS